MSNKTIKHFIFIRFFPNQDPKYPHDVLDVDFLSNQLDLAINNVLKSMENQTNQNFDLVFILNPKFFDNPKYEFIFSTLKNSTALSIIFVKTAEIPNLVKDAFNSYDFVIQSRLDFDDFMIKDAVEDTQNKVNECDNILGYGYCRGYLRHVNSELYPRYKFYDGIGHLGALQSLILKSSFAKNLPFIGIFNLVHTRLKTGIQDFVEKNGVEFSENMFQQNTSKVAYIYFKTEFSREHLVKKGTTKFKVPKYKKPLTTEDITKKQLEEEFGFYYEVNSIK